MNWNDAFGNKTADEKVKSLNNIFLNIFRNFILIRLSDLTISVPTGRILRLFHPWEIGPNWLKDITLFQLKRIKTFSPAQKWSSRTKNGTQTNENWDNPSTMPKAYWSILNTFLNNKKIPNIPPLNVNDKTISNSDKKGELFNSHFASQCTPINNSSVLPSWEYKNNGWLASVNRKKRGYLPRIKKF